MRKSGLVFVFFLERGYGVNDEIGILFVFLVERCGFNDENRVSFFVRRGSGLVMKMGY